jgi:hypothetical protein
VITEYKVFDAPEDGEFVGGFDTRKEAVAEARKLQARGLEPVVEKWTMRNTEDGWPSITDIAI